MHPEKQAFLDRIAADRYDGQTRYVFADWLEEHGMDDEAAVQRKWTKERQEAEDWIRKYAKEAINSYCKTEDESYDNLLEDLKNGHIRSYGDSNNSRHDFDEDLWRNLEILGILVDPDELGYSCAC